MDDDYDYMMFYEDMEEALSELAYQHHIFDSEIRDLLLDLLVNRFSADITPTPETIPDPAVIHDLDHLVAEFLGKHKNFSTEALATTLAASIGMMLASPSLDREEENRQIHVVIYSMITAYLSRSDPGMPRPRTSR